MSRMPSWRIPKNIIKVIEDADGVWEDDRWTPLLLSAMTGTEFDGREIPIAWQIEFDPSDEECEAASEALEEADVDADGYGWGEHIRDTIKRQDPKLAKRLHLDDCETDTCVVWVEDEEDCRKLIETTWRLIHSHV